MCGIVGIAFFDPSARPLPGELEGMCESILHRGPDEGGMQVQDGVALGMRRLSIIDLAGGSQPIANEDGTLRVVFNGEIYNYRELRADLIRAGHRFTTNSDTEVIVHAYEQYGDAVFRRLNGMFSIALHDLRKRRSRQRRQFAGFGNDAVAHAEAGCRLPAKQVQR